MNFFPLGRALSLMDKRGDVVDQKLSDLEDLVRAMTASVRKAQRLREEKGAHHPVIVVLSLL